MDGLQRLEILGVEDFDTTQLPLMLTACSKTLTHFIADEQTFTDDIDAALSVCLRLRRLSVCASTEFSGQCLGNLRELHELNATRCSALSNEALARATSLRELRISHTPISDAGVAPLRELRVLEAMGTYIEGSFLPDHKNLLHFQFHGAPVRGEYLLVSLWRNATPRCFGSPCSFGLSEFYVLLPDDSARWMEYFEQVLEEQCGLKKSAESRKPSFIGPWYHTLACASDAYSKGTRRLPVLFEHQSLLPPRSGSHQQQAAQAWPQKKAVFYPDYCECCLARHPPSRSVYVDDVALF
jgi:hypothetical protein